MLTVCHRNCADCKSQRIVYGSATYGFTCAAGFRRWADTDVLLGIGSRLELAWLRWPRRLPGQQSLRTVLIDIDPVQAVRLEPAVAIVADAREAAAALAVELGQRAGAAPDRGAEFRAAKKQTASEFRDIGADLDYLAAIRAALPADGFFAEEICQAGFVSYFGFPVHAPRLYEGREVGARRHNPDFAAAEAFGAAGYSVRTPEALEATLTKALADGRPAVIEVKTTIGEAAATPWKYLMPGRQ